MATQTSNPAVTVDWLLPAYGVLTCLTLRAAWSPCAEDDDDEPPTTTTTSAARGGGRFSFVHVAFVGLAACYAFLSQPLGIVDIGAASPFASIKVHSGSNHWLMPTGLLFQDHRSSLLEGTVARVEACNSTWLNALHPGSVTSLLPPSTRDTLVRLGHVGLEFSPTTRRVFGEAARLAMPEEPFVRYTLPQTQLRRDLQDLRERGEPFSLTYSRLPGVRGDERWRASAEGDLVVRLDEDGQGGRRCEILHSSKSSKGSKKQQRRRPCDDTIDEDPALLESTLPAFLERLTLFFPYPIIDDAPDLVCLD